MTSKNQFEDIMNNWQYKFPGVPLTESHFKDPYLFMEALLFLLDRLGIDNEAVTEPPSEEEKNEHTHYYSDLIPVMNMMRVVNHIVCNTPHANVEINVLNFLLPTLNKSSQIMLVFFNLIIFYEERIADIATEEQEIFHMVVEVRNLKDQKYTLLKMLNEQAQEKAERVERSKTLLIELHQLAEDIKNEQKPLLIEKQQVNDVKKESNQTLMLYEQTKAHKDALLEEIAQKTALKVNDAEDVKAQVEQVKKKMAEVFKYIDALNETMKQKDNSLKNLHTVKSTLDCGSTCRHDILDNVNDSDDNELDEDDTKLLDAEVSEEQEQLSEIQRLKAQVIQRRKENDIKKKLQNQQYENTIQEVIEQRKHAQEEYAMRLQHTEEIKAATNKHAEKRNELMQLLQEQREKFKAQHAAIQDASINKLLQAEKVVIKNLGSYKLRDRD